MQPPYPPGAMPAAPVNPDLLPDHPQADGAQTFGIIALVLSLVGFGIVAPFALHRARGVRTAIKANPGVYRPTGPAQVAFITSAIATVVFVIMTLLLVLAIATLTTSS